MVCIHIHLTLVMKSTVEHYLSKFEPGRMRAACMERCLLLAQICDLNELPLDLMRMLFYYSIVALHSPASVFTENELETLFRKYETSDLVTEDGCFATLYTTGREDKANEEDVYVSLVVTAEAFIVCGLSRYKITEEETGTTRFMRHTAECKGTLLCVGLGWPEEQVVMQKNNDIDIRAVMDEFLLTYNLLKKPLIVLDEVRQDASFYESFKNLKRENNKEGGVRYIDAGGFVCAVACMIREHYCEQAQQDRLYEKFRERSKRPKFNRFSSKLREMAQTRNLL